VTQENDAPPTLAETIEDQFRPLTFTRTGGNEHYGAGDKQELARRNARIESFLHEETIQDPDLIPVRYDSDTIQKTANTYDVMLDILFSQPSRTPEDDVLIDRIIQKTAELFRYEELHLAVGSVAMGDRDHHRQVASEMSLEMMGGIDHAAFGTLINQLLDTAASSSSLYAQELQGMIMWQPGAEEGLTSVEMSEETRRCIGEDLVSLFPGLDEFVENHDDPQPVSAVNAVPLFEETQRIAQLSEQWGVELDEGKSVSSSQAKKKIVIGRHRTDFKNERDAIAIAVHEAIGHSGRGKGVSFPNYLDFEEGLATCLEQIISGESRIPGVQYYLAIGLQAGADRGGVPRNYRETFEILWRRQALLAEQSGGEVDVEKARYAAQRQVQRTRRGGAIDTRDASYFLGAQKAADWLNQITGLPEFDRRQRLLEVLINRYDPTDPEQQAMIRMRARSPQ